MSKNEIPQESNSDIFDENINNQLSTDSGIAFIKENPDNSDVLISEKSQEVVVEESRVQREKRKHDLRNNIRDGLVGDFLNSSEDTGEFYRKLESLVSESLVKENPEFKDDPEVNDEILYGRDLSSKVNSGGFDLKAPVESEKDNQLDENSSEEDLPSLSSFPAWGSGLEDVHSSGDGFDQRIMDPESQNKNDGIEADGIAQSGVVDTKEPQLEKEAPEKRKKRGRGPEGKSLMETLGSLETEEEREEFLEKFRSRRATVMVDGERQYIRLKDGEGLNLGGNDTLTFEFLDEHGDPILDDNGKARIKEQKISEIKYRDWKQVSPGNPKEVIYQNGGKEYKKEKSKARYFTEEEAILRESLKARHQKLLGELLTFSLKGKNEYSGPLQSFFSQRFNEVNNYNNSKIVKNINNFLSNVENKTIAREIEVLEGRLEGYKKTVERFLAEPQVVAPEAKPEVLKTAEAEVAQKIEQDRYAKAFEVYKNNLPENQRNTPEAVAQFNKFLAKQQEDFNLNSLTVCSLMADGVRLDKAQERTVIQAVWDAAKKGGGFAVGGALGGGLLGGVALGPIGAVLGAPAGAAFGVFRAVRELGKEKATIPTPNGEIIVTVRDDNQEGYYLLQDPALKPFEEKMRADYKKDFDEEVEKIVAPIRQQEEERVEREEFAQERAESLSNKEKSEKEMASEIRNRLIPAIKEEIQFIEKFRDEVLPLTEKLTGVLSIYNTRIVEETINEYLDDYRQDLSIVEKSGDYTILNGREKAVLNKKDKYRKECEVLMVGVKREIERVNSSEYLANNEKWEKLNPLKEGLRKKINEGIKAAQKAERDFENTPELGDYFKIKIGELIDRSRKIDLLTEIADAKNLEQEVDELLAQVGTKIEELKNKNSSTDRKEIAKDQPEPKDNKTKVETKIEAKKESSDAEDLEKKEKIKALQEAIKFELIKRSNRKKAAAQDVISSELRRVSKKEDEYFDFMFAEIKKIEDVDVLEKEYQRLINGGEDANLNETASKKSSEVAEKSKVQKNDLSKTRKVAEVKDRKEEIVKDLDLVEPESDTKKYNFFDDPAFKETAEIFNRETDDRNNSSEVVENSATKKPSVEPIPDILPKNALTETRLNTQTETQKPVSNNVDVTKESAENIKLKEQLEKK